ncbi:MAG: Hsp20/alpha crystallin family protein [Lentisphaeria bacterium]|nr:Hsp20/alpha crystallin family protein [Lentisphaeria bacterium]
MNLLAKREHEVPAALEKVFPGVDELVRTMFGRMIEPGSGLLRGSVFDSRWETEVHDDDVVVKISCPGCKNDEFQLEIVGDFLNFKVHHCEESAGEGKKNKHYVFRERSCAEYEESIKLPVPVKGAEAKAKYAHGVVSVTIPRDMQQPSPAKTIKVHCDK